jgi:hypothetical protein
MTWNDFPIQKQKPHKEGRNNINPLFSIYLPGKANCQKAPLHCSKPSLSSTKPVVTISCSIAEEAIHQYIKLLLLVMVEGILQFEVNRRRGSLNIIWFCNVAFSFSAITAVHSLPRCENGQHRGKLFPSSACYSICPQLHLHALRLK